MTGAAPKCELWIIALTTSFLIWSFVFLQIANRKYNSQSIKIWYVLLFEHFTATAIALFGLRLASNPVCKDQCHCNPVWRPLLCETLNSGDIFCLNPLLSFPKISVSRQEFTSVKLSQFEFCRKLIDSVFFEVSACTILYNSQCIWDQQYNKGIRDFGLDILLTQGNCWWSKNVYVSQFAESMSKIFEKAFYHFHFVV